MTGSLTPSHTGFMAFKPLVEMIYVVGTDVAQILIFHSITESILLF